MLYFLLSTTFPFQVVFQPGQVSKVSLPVQKCENIVQVSIRWLRRQLEQLWEHRCLAEGLYGKARFFVNLNLGACWRVCGAGGAVPLLGRGGECQLPLQQGEDCGQQEVGSNSALLKLSPALKSPFPQTNCRSIKLLE